MLPIPPDVLATYAAWSWAAVSVHPGNSVVHRLSSGHETRFLKIVRQGWTPSTEAEAERTKWVRPHLPVPEVLAAGTSRGSAWILTGGIEGLDGTSETLRADIPGLVRRLAQGLRMFHQVPADACPFRFRLDDALRVARYRLSHGLIDPARDFHPEHAHLTARAAVDELFRSRPAREDPVVCHGDYCVPNILLRENRVVGYVDLGELGVADRWWDLAVATWSLTWNFAQGYEAEFLDAYGIAPDESRIRYYRLLYDVVS